jgi:hypothetical protein
MNANRDALLRRSRLHAAADVESASPRSDGLAVRLRPALVAGMVPVGGWGPAARAELDPGRVACAGHDAEPGGPTGPVQRSGVPMGTSAATREEKEKAVERL